MNAQSGARRSRVFGLLAVASLVAGTAACPSDPADEPNDAPDASRVTPSDDAAPDPDASPGSDATTADAEVVEPDANTRCVLPLEVDLDAGYGSLLYNHPDCSVESGIVDDAPLVFEDTIDVDQFYSAHVFSEDWQMQTIEYPDNDCIVDEGEDTLVCTDADVGDLIPVQLLDGAGFGQLDVEFRLDHDDQSVTVESVIYSE